jgi:hypothetical protein
MVIGGASSTTGSLDLLKLDKTLEADEISRTPSGKDASSSTMDDVLISRLAAVGRIGFVLAMLVRRPYSIPGQKQLNKVQPEPMGGNANGSMY